MRKVFAIYGLHQLSSKEFQKPSKLIFYAQHEPAALLRLNQSMHTHKDVLYLCCDLAKYAQHKELLFFCYDLGNCSKIQNTTDKLQINSQTVH